MCFNLSHETGPMSSPMTIDLLTILVVRVCVDALVCWAFAFQFRRHPEIAGPGWWALATLLSVFGSLGLGLRGLAPDFLTIGLANSLLAMAIVLSWMGLRSHLGLSLPTRFILPAAIALWLTNTFLYAVWDSIPARQVVFSVVGLTLLYLMLRDIRQVDPDGRQVELQNLRRVCWMEALVLGGVAIAVWWVPQDHGQARLSALVPAMLIIFMLDVLARFVLYSALVSSRLQQLNEKARRDLQIREADSRALIENLSAGIMVFRPDQTLVSINSAARSFLGWGPGGANNSLPEPTRSGWVMLREDGQPMPRHEMPFERVLATGQPVRDVVMGMPLDAAGATRWALCNAYPENDAQGGLRHVVLTFVDISSLRAMQAEQKALQSQLAQSQKMEALGTLAGGVAHDFNNILAAILGNADLARHDLPRDAPARESLHEISTAARRGRELVRQILAFSRQQPLEQSPVDVRAVVNEACTLLRTALPSQVQLVQEVDCNTPPIQADATQLGQVFLNLGTNAVHALQGRSGRIEFLLDTLPADDPAVPAELAQVCLTRGSGVVRVRVHDNGCGMSEAVKRRMFEPFFTTKPVGQGTGLGLPVVLGIVEAHGGAIEVNSEPGHGTRFSLFFPAVNGTRLAPDGRVSETAAPNDVTMASDGADPVAQSSESEPMTENRAAGPRHILYLDDDDTLVFLVRRLLERRGYRVTGVSDQQQAIDAVRANPDGFDLMLTDYNMPGMSGIEVAEEVLRISPSLVVAVASGYINEELEQKAKAAGVREVVFKTDAIESFCEVVERLSRAAP